MTHRYTFPRVTEIGRRPEVPKVRPMAKSAARGTPRPLAEARFFALLRAEARHE
jgi:hypothetical protein